jgi:hypothetical protein
VAGAWGKLSGTYGVRDAAVKCHGVHISKARDRTRDWQVQIVLYSAGLVPCTRRPTARELARAQPALYFEIPACSPGLPASYPQGAPAGDWRLGLVAALSHVTRNKSVENGLAAAPHSTCARRMKAPFLIAGPPLDRSLRANTANSPVALYYLPTRHNGHPQHH